MSSPAAPNNKSSVIAGGYVVILSKEGVTGDAKRGRRGVEEGVRRGWREEGERDEGGGKSG